MQIEMENKCINTPEICHVRQCTAMPLRTLPLTCMHHQLHSPGSCLHSSSITTLWHEGPLCFTWAAQAHRPAPLKRAWMAAAPDIQSICQHRSAELIHAHDSITPQVPHMHVWNKTVAPPPRNSLTPFLPRSTFPTKVSQS